MLSNNNYDERYAVYLLERLDRLTKVYFKESTR
jgi:hypothetical protein